MKIENFNSFFLANIHIIKEKEIITHNYKNKNNLYFVKANKKYYIVGLKAIKLLILKDIIPK